MQEVQVPLPVGSMLRGHYLVESLLGKGCSSAVYLVSDQRIQHSKPHQFVLKEVVAPNKRERGRLIFEGALLRRFHHQAFPRIYHVFNDGNYDRVYLLMEYIVGTSLEALRQGQPERRFSWLEAVSLVAPMIDALDYLHSQQPPIIHRDIKPANIIVSGARTALVDFGLVEEFDPDLPSVAVRSCSSAYRAPEQYGGGVDRRTDVYGLGATFYTLVTGMVPVDALSRMTQLGNGEIDPLNPVNEVIPSVPAHLAEVIDRAMSVHAHDRFSSVERFWEVLWESVNVFPVELSSPMPDNMPSGSSRRPVISRPAPTVENVGAPTLQKQPQVKRVPLFVSGRPGFLMLLARVERLWEGLWSPRRLRSPMSSGPPSATSRRPDASKPESSAARPSTVTVPGHQPRAPRAMKHGALVPGGSVPIPEPERAVDQTAAMLLPKPPPFVSMVDSVKEPKELDATEPRLPVVSMPDADKEREGSDTTKSLPEVSQVAPMSTRIKEQEDLDDIIDLRKPPRVVRSPLSLRILGMLFIVLALLISLGIGVSFLSRVHNHAAIPLPTVTAPTFGPTRAPPLSQPRIH